jgi:hypothetical protein
VLSKIATLPLVREPIIEENAACGQFLSAIGQCENKVGSHKEY